MPALLRLANIEKSYIITKTQKQSVLKGIDLEFNSGELVALIGESGCGKSTLINILGGLDSEYTGSVVCKGKFLRDYTESQMDDYRKKRVGLIFQNYNLISHMTIVENVEIAMQMTDIEPKVRHDRTMELLKLVGLNQYAKKLPSQLSGGQCQRVAIARALANNPSIILADEPTGALDKESADIIMKILKKIVESGKLVIIVTHSQLVANHCSRVVQIDDGKIVSDEKKYDIKITGNYEKVIVPKPIKTKDIMKLSFRNLKQTKSRSILVSVGMSIGIAAFVLILCLSSGLRNYVKVVYADNLQSTEITVTKNNNDNFSMAQFSSIEDLTGVKTVKESSIIKNATYVYNDNTSDIGELSGFYDDFYPAILYGTLPTTDSNIIINEAFASSLTSGSIIAVVGTQIDVTYNGEINTFTIAGIYEDNTNSSSEPNALIDNNDLLTISSSTYNCNVLYVKLDDVSYINSVLADLGSLGLHTYQSTNAAQTALTYIDLGTKVLTGVSGISLVVAAIMIFVVLYISIIERTKEIGILRAVGAQKTDIRKMFIFEAGMLGLMGGVIGCTFSLIISIMTNIITHVSLQNALISYHVLYYILGLLISLFVSILAGIAPAMKASDLDPVESLRYE